MIGWEYDAAGNTNGNGDMEMEIATGSSIWTFSRWTGLTGPAAGREMEQLSRARGLNWQDVL